LPSSIGPSSKDHLETPSGGRRHRSKPGRSSVFGRVVNGWSASRFGFARRVFARSIGRGLAGQTLGLPTPTADDVRIQIVGKTRGGVLAGVRARKGAGVAEDLRGLARMRKSKEGRPGNRPGRTRCPTRAPCPPAENPSLHSRSAPSWSAPDRSSCNPCWGFGKHNLKCTRRCRSRVGPVPPSEPPCRARQRRTRSQKGARGFCRQSYSF